jgi:hypothetical protein
MAAKAGVGLMAPSRYKISSIARACRTAGKCEPLASDPLKERIRELCTKAVTATGAEVDLTLAELQKALHQHAEKLREQAASKLKQN